jgi:hypothetical protein
MRQAKEEASFGKVDPVFPRSITHAAGGEAEVDQRFREAFRRGVPAAGA